MSVKSNSFDSPKLVILAFLVLSIAKVAHPVVFPGSMPRMIIESNPVVGSHLSLDQQNQLE